MPNLFDTWRFTVTYSAVDTTVRPLTDSLKFRWDKDQDKKFYRKKLETRLLFRGADFTYFKGIYEDDTCDDVTMSIEEYCGGSWSERYSGKIAVAEGNWNYSRCEVELEVMPVDVYDCIDSVIEKKVNWLDYGDRMTLKSVIGTIETTTCTYNSTPPGGNESLWFYKGCWGTGFNNDTTPDPSLAWRPLTHSQTVIISPTSMDISTTWARETISSVGAPAGLGWINISGTTWVRPITYAGDAIDETSGLVRTWEAETLNVAATNGRLLQDILPDIVTDLGCASITTVRSDWFGINRNTPVDNPTNDAYDFAADVDERMQKVIIFQKSDVVNEDASNDATRLDLSLQDFFDAMRDGLNLYWSVEDGDTLRIEHYSYYEGSNGMDLTTLDSGIHIDGLHQFKTDGGIPYFEAFAYQESFSSEFTQKQITYPASCATESAVTRQQRAMCADFGGLLNNPDAGLEGWVFCCADYQTGTTYVMDTTDDVANGAMAWKALFTYVWSFGRYRNNPDTDVSGLSTLTVNSLKRRREQVKITIPYCCDGDFVPTDLVQTQMGWGEVKQATQDTGTGTLELILMHE